MAMESIEWTDETNFGHRKTVGEAGSSTWSELSVCNGVLEFSQFFLIESSFD